MGCVSSKNVTGCCLSPPPSRHRSRRGSSSPPPPAAAQDNRVSRSPEPLNAPAQAQAPGELDEIKKDEPAERETDDNKDRQKKLDDVADLDDQELDIPAVVQFERIVQAEQMAAGWPSWLTAVAGEAIDGWLPLKSNSFERLDKIGEGTYSNVYRARDLTTGKMVAVKKVRFDNFQPESVQFMSREILILRRLDHPNVMKLQGIITSRLSCSLYLVFEYMEHDLSGLLSCPNAKFTDSQIKCFMRQLLMGLDHCHERGIMHRDIKTSNILVNDEGILKIADFGLANFMQPKNKEPLTSHVVTLWYRSPELLLGATKYREAVDLWSVGCVLGELYMGRPLIKGRTEVEQLHKIFRLCGSLPEDYWKRSRLPLASVFKPQHPYKSMLRERCRELPTTAVNLMETLLSIEPEKRGTAASALNSEYFNTKPYPCEPSSLPTCPPSKEMDVRIREEAKRMMIKADTATKVEASRNKTTKKGGIKAPQESNDSSCKVVPMSDADANANASTQATPNNPNVPRHRGNIESRASKKQSYDTKSDISQASGVSSIRSVPTQVASSINFARAKKKKQPDVFTRLHPQPMPRCQRTNSNDTTSETSWDPDRLENEDPPSGKNPRVQPAKPALLRKQARLHRHGSFDSADVYGSEEHSTTYLGNKKTARRIISGPLVPHSQEQLHRSRFYRD